MQFTNKLNLPLPLLRAVTNDPYSRGDSDYTVTELISPPRIAALKRRHASELVEDASDRLWSLVGQIGHLVIERAAMTEIAERRFFAVCLGKKISGQMDLLEGTTALDFKFTSIWTAKDGAKPEWVQQLNMLALLAAMNGTTVLAANIVAIYRDWSVGEARRNREYPQTQVQMFPIHMWTRDAQEDFMEARIRAHIAAETVLPECTPNDRWAKPERWAVMRKGRERAVKLYDDPVAAASALMPSKGEYVEHRPGVQTRCLDYCPVSNQCSWWKDYQDLQPAP